DGAFPCCGLRAREKLGDVCPPAPLRCPRAWTVRDDCGPDRHLHQRPPVPLLILHGCADLTVPCSHGERLYRTATPPVWLWLDPQRRHGEMLYTRHWREQLVNWLEQQVPAP